MNGFNLSEWSIRNRSVVIYLMIMIIVAGALSFVHLGRAEDPVFTIRTMVVQAQWPGATLEETLLQVTERLERRLQEVPNLDVLRSYTNAGRTVIFVDLLGSTHGRMVDDTWDDVRKKIGDIRQTLPQGIVGPFFNDEFGDTYGTIYGFTEDGFTFRELRDNVENIRSELLNIPDVSKIDVLGAQAEADDAHRHDDGDRLPQRLHELADCALDDGRLIRHQRRLDADRKIGGDLAHRALDVAAERQDVTTFAHRDGEPDGGRAVDAKHRLRWIGEAAPNLCDITQPKNSTTGREIDV